MIDPETKKYIDAAIDRSRIDARYDTSNTVYHTHNSIDSPRISFYNITSSFLTVATATNKTAPVFVFGQKGFPANPTVTSVFLISNDTTAGNVSLYSSGKTVATIAKGTTAGALVGATSLTNSTQVSLLKVQSDSAGNATVIVTLST